MFLYRTKRIGDDMVSCLILYNKAISSLTKCKILRVMFKDEQFEINVIEKNTVIIYVWNVEKALIWQAALDFEMAGISVGYGFGALKQGVKRKAEERLQLRLYPHGSCATNVHEEKYPYQH